MSLQDTKGQPASLSDAINMLMENPQIISSVASALGNMSQGGASATDKASTPDVEKTEVPPVDRTPASIDLSSLISSISPLISGTSQDRQHSTYGKGSESRQREALLYALKPYVSQSRQDAIDYIIKISRMSEVLKTIGS